MNMEDLWMNDCKIEDWNEVSKLAHMAKLKTIYLERNPIMRDTMYRKKVMLTLPSGSVSIWFIFALKDQSL